MTAREAYEERLIARRRAAAAQEATSRLVGTARVAVSLLGLGIVIAVAANKLDGSAMLGALAAVLVFVALVVVHARVEAKKDWLLALARTYERGLARLDGTWRALPEGPACRHGLGAYGVPAHPYARDLDLFGKGSVAHFVDTTSTLLGAERLAAMLATPPSGDSFPGPIVARQEAARDLAPRVDFREEIAALGAFSAERTDPKPFLAWVEAEARPVPVVFRVLARVLPIVTIGALLFRARVPWPLWALPLLAQYAIGWTVGARVDAMVKAVDAAHDAFGPYVGMLRAIERETFASPLLREAQSALRGSGSLASVEMKRLARATGFLDARQNGVFKLFIGPALSWDLNCVLALEGWRARVRRSVRGWLEAVAEVEALATFGTISYENPEATWPSLVETPSFVAEGLEHPLLDKATRVPNDVAIEGRGVVLVITGSNMSGKSTLLRAIGTNAVLALAGAPVTAKRLQVGPVAVVTSIQIGDSLEEGVSHFYAELKRLRFIVAMASATPVPLFLLDEILHGTNARERIEGARAVVRDLSAKGALGCVTTHDLAIGALEEEIPGRARNVHFEEQVEGEVMTFDYKMKPGVVTSSNALRLMKAMGLPV